MSPVDPNLHDRFFVSQRIRPMVNQREVSTLGADKKAAGEPVCFVQQRRLQLKEDLRAYSDASKSTEVFRSKARQVFDPRTPNSWGAIAAVESWPRSRQTLSS
jgi:hypothetical protein